MTVLTYGIALIGAGVIAPTHAAAIAQLPEARLVAVCDVVEGKARALADRFGGEVETDYRRLLARPDVDVCEIVTPSGTHAELGIAAAEAGKHVIVTKPIDVSLARIDRLIETCRRHRVKLGAIHQFRSYTVYRRLKAAIDRGELGHLLLGNAFVKWYRAESYYQSADWRGTWALDGGALMNQSIHWIDVLQWLLGPVASLSAHTATLDHAIEVEDIASAALRFQNGALGVVQGATCIYKGLPTRIEVHGQRGNVVVENEQVVLWDVAGQADSAPGGEAGAGGGWASDPAAGLHTGVAAHVEQIRDVLRAIAEDREPELNGPEARKAVEIILAIYRSHREGRRVDLPLAAVQ
ncbi:MAG: Gfo/Idh/MocA family oxidoreductase [Chloroflexi bacterium]|nr:Gfo/Idh/MocA family oxidoreductase [Chloroflexota bacterium]